ncbi:MAG: hypothetical protein KAS60_02870 [Thermoplasmata archaeon]|nr:hypothetical protein [Thermoplasmata archaeon]
MGDEKRIGCPRCEAKLEAGSRFCNYCGHSLTETGKEKVPRRETGAVTAKKRVLVLISSVEKALRSAKKSGAEIASIQVALDHVRRIASEENFEEAEGKAKILLRKSREANEKRKKELMILNAELIVDKARELGADITTAHDLIKKAYIALESGIYGDVVEFVRKAKKQATEAKRNRRARVMIQNFKPKLDYAYEIGADIDVAREYFRSAEESFERAVYGEVQEYLKLARTEVNEVKRFKRASDLIEKAEESLHSSRATGADTGEIEETLRQAETALHKREFDDVKALTKEARKQADRATRRNEIESALKSMCQEIEYIKSIEVDITRADGIAEKAREALEKGDNRRARRYLSQLRIWLTKEKRKLGATDEDIPIQMLGASKRLGDIKEIVDEIRKVGVDISYVEDLFEEVKQAFQVRDLAKAEKILSEIEEMALSLKESLTVAARDLLQKAKKEAEEARKENLNIGAAGETVRNGLRALEEGHIDEALQYAEIARNLVDRAKKERVVDLAKGGLLRMEVMITDSKKLGLEVDEAETFYRKASADFERGEFQKIEAYVPKVELSAKKAKRLYIITKAQDELEGASFAIDDIERMGADVSDANDLLKDARDALFEENYDAVMELSRRIRDIVGEAEKEKIIERFGAKSQGIATMIAGAKAMGIDIEHAQALLGMADEYLGKQEIVQAKDLIRRAEVSAGKKIQDFIKDKYPKVFVNMPTKGFEADVWNRLILEIINEGNLRSENIDIKLEGDFEVRGLETISEIDPNETKTIEVGVKPKKEGDLPVDMSVSYQRPFDNQVFGHDETKQLSIKSYGTYVVEDVFLVHLDGRLIGHETRKYREDIDEDIFSGMLTIVQEFVKDSFRTRSEGGLKRLDFGNSMIVIERGSHVYLACVVAGDEPVFLPLHMVEIIGEIEGHYSDVLENWSGLLTELEGVDEIIRRLMYVSDAAGADLVGLEKSRVVQTIGAIEEAKKAGADITEAEILIQDAMENMDKQDWKNAWDLVREAEDSANSARVQYIAMVEDQLAAAKEIVDKANELGIRMNEAEELFEIATQAINTGQFATITSIIDRIKDIISRGGLEIERLESEKNMREARLLVEAAKQEGLDVFEAERLLRSAESSYQSSDVDEVSSLLASVGGVVEKSRNKRWKGEIERRVDSLTSIVAKAREVGFDVTEANGLMVDARKVLESDDIDKMEAYLERLESPVEEIKKKLLLAEAEKRLSEIVTLVNRAKEAGLGVEEETQLTSDARSILDEGNLDELERIIMAVESSAGEKIDEFLKDKRPRLHVRLPKKGFQEDAWNRYRVEVENRGNLGAKDVEVRLDGDFEVKGLEPISEMDVNEKKHLDVGIKPKKSGEIPIDASISYRRPFDDKNYETYAQENLNVENAGTYLVEDVFLIHNQGNLVVRESRKYREDLNEKKFSTMIGAVQSFVKDSFSQQGSTGLSKLDFGESKVLVERGKSVHLAAVVMGDEPRLLSLYIIEILKEIEGTYGGVLLDWNGSMEGLEGIREIVRRLLFMSEFPGAELGALDDSVISRAFGLGRTPEPALARDEAEKLISDITKEIEEMGYEDIWKKVAESIPTAEGEEGEMPPGMTRDEAFSALSVEILKSEVGELDDEEKLRDYLALINGITSAVETARSEKVVDSDVPVLVAVLPDTQEIRETVETFERVIKGEANIRGLETVPVGDEWDGLKIEAIPHLDMILGKYRFWARKIETLLKSQSAWKIKRGLDKGAYFLGIEGQSVEISPSMVSFEILLPDNVVRRKFSGGSLYVSFPQTAEADDSTPSSGLAEGAEADGADELSITTEIVGRILEMRSDMNLEDEQRVEVKISANEDLLAELESQKDRIARETNSKSLDFVTKENIEGEDGYTIEWQVADETFMISLRQSQEAGSPA